MVDNGCGMCYNANMNGDTIQIWRGCQMMAHDKLTINGWMHALDWCDELLMEQIKPCENVAPDDPNYMGDDMRQCGNCSACKSNIVVNNIADNLGGIMDHFTNETIVGANPRTMWICKQCGNSHYYCQWDHECGETPELSQHATIKNGVTIWEHKYVDDGPFELLPSLMICLECGNNGIYDAFDQPLDNALNIP